MILPSEESPASGKKVTLQDIECWLDELQKQFHEGLISEEEFQEGKIKIAQRFDSSEPA